MTARTGKSFTESFSAPILAAYGIDLWPVRRVATLAEAHDAAQDLGWAAGHDVVLKATAERLRQRPDLAHVWRNIDDEDDMRRLLGWGVDGIMTDRPDVLARVLGGVPVA